MKKKVIFLAIFMVGITFFIYLSNIQMDEQIKENKAYKIGVLTISEAKLVKIDGIREGLKQYGLTEDNVEIIIKNSNGNVEIMEELVQELAEEGVDVIITLDVNGTRVAQKFTEDKEIPVVFIGVACTVGLGLVENHISTGCNITGIDSYYIQLSGKRIEFLKKIVPSVENILVLYNPTTTPFSQSSVFLYEAAEKYDVKLDVVPVTTVSETIQVLNEKSTETDAVMLMCNVMINSIFDKIIDVTSENKIPVIGVSSTQVKNGALAFYGGTGYAEGVQAARIVTNILKGQDPRIIPVESPEKLELYVNVETARKFGINIDPSKMPYVDHFIFQ